MHSVDSLVDRTLRLNGELAMLAGLVNRAPLQVFARAHLLVSDASVDVRQRGRPRDDSDAAPALIRLAGELCDSSGALAESSSSKKPALVLALVAHAEIATARPFATDNGLVARAVERVVLIARGVDPISLVATEAGHRSLLEDYPSALAAYATGTSDGVARWLLYGANAMTRAANLSTAAPT